ncbi:MAG: hypothetical protein ABSA13_07860 [Beijerinckiaceae bacterium]|jgi:hypothetical protein
MGKELEGTIPQTCTQAFSPHTTFGITYRIVYPGTCGDRQSGCPGDKPDDSNPRASPGGVAPALTDRLRGLESGATPVEIKLRD